MLISVVMFPIDVKFVTTIPDDPSVMSKPEPEFAVISNDMD